LSGSTRSTRRPGASCSTSCSRPSTATTSTACSSTTASSGRTSPWATTTTPGPCTPTSTAAPSRPADHTDPDWIEWRSKKIDEYAEQFVAEIQAARPGLIISVSPAPYPWVYENYCLDWIQWAADGLWDEYIPQCYRYDYDAFEATWDQQIDMLTERGAEDAVELMLAGVLTTGSRPDPVPWADLEKSIEHVRSTGGGGHVWWFSRGVLDEYPDEIAALYDVAGQGHASHPRRPDDWRPAPITMDRSSGNQWVATDVPGGTYRVIGRADGVWTVIATVTAAPGTDRLTVTAGDPDTEAVELLIDRRSDMSMPR
jgi:hypothetical protein